MRSLWPDMANAYFAFKQFTVRQEQAAFRVGTDGCLLGAWAPVAGARRILDIGTGTGVIALMLAQRNPEAEITAIEADEGSALQAEGNLANSPWSDRLKCLHTTLQTFAPAHRASFDLIACNPPFFANSTPNPDKRKTHTRHEGSLTLGELVEHSTRLLAPGGTLALVLPIERRTHLLQLAAQHGWSEHCVSFVRPTPAKPVHRFLTRLSPRAVETPVSNEWTIYDAENRYSKEARKLWREFYLYL